MKLVLSRKKDLPICEAVSEDVEVEPKDRTVTVPTHARALNISLTLKKTSTIAGNVGAASMFKWFLG